MGDYRELLLQAKSLIAPRTYLEVGIREGGSLCLPPIPEVIVAVDPAPRLSPGAYAALAGAKALLLLPTTSDEAFATLSSCRLLGGRKFDMVFIDGLPHCEVVLRDIANAAKMSRDDAFIFVRGVFPGNAIEASRQQTAETWMGDVYKIVPIFFRHLPSVRTLLVANVPPSGMFVIRVAAGLYDAITRDYDVFVLEMAEYDFEPTLAALYARSIVCELDGLAEFLTQK
jgi:predicted O-methyltransferase YrrM